MITNYRVSTVYLEEPELPQEATQIVKGRHHPVESGLRLEDLKTLI